MKTKIILTIFIFLNIIYAQKSDNSFVLKLNYVSAKFNFDDVRDSGFGTDLNYKVKISKRFMFRLAAGFNYLSYEVRQSDEFENPLKGSIVNVNYTKNVKFYNFLVGFNFVYVFPVAEKYGSASNKFLKNIFPYAGIGFYTTFPYKVQKNTYNESQLDLAEKKFIENKNSSYWLPGIATLPFILGVEYKFNPMISVELGFGYSLLNYDEFTKNNGFNNVFDIYLGFLYYL